MLTLRVRSGCLVVLVRAVMFVHMTQQQGGKGEEELNQVTLRSWQHKASSLEINL